MNLSIEHKTTYSYDPAISQLALRLRLFPASYQGQSVTQWDVRVNDQVVVPIITDGFGDQIAIWTEQRDLETVEIVASGEVATQDKAGVVAGLRRRPPAAIFLRETELTCPTTEILDLAHSIPGHDALSDDTLTYLHGLMGAVHKAIDYRQGVTSESTSAAEALRLGAGVCQDHAHVFVSAARSLGIPARYVTGYLLGSDDSDQTFATHAWAEASVPKLGWVGFDASNNLSPTDEYVRLICGHDAPAAAPIRGVVVADAEVTLEASVQIVPQQRQQQQ